MRILLCAGIICIASMLWAQEDNPFLRRETDGHLSLTEQGASHFARLALDCIHREYPNKLNQVLPNDSMLLSPQQLHPAFYGCFDWHSAVHGHWMLVRLLKRFPDLPESKEIIRKLEYNLKPEHIKGEVAYFEQASKSFERMYGWSWLLKLGEELNTWETDTLGQHWYNNLEPLIEVIVDRYKEFLPKQTYPVRTGVHPNTAFGMAFAWDYAVAVNDVRLKDLIRRRALSYYQFDQSCPTGWEPSGEDFLSPCLEEANLMARILNQDEFHDWFRRFLPKKQLKALHNPAYVADRSDPKIVHLDGLNLSRAWCFYRISPVLKRKGQRKSMNRAAASHLEATIPNIASEHYEGSHWLASFAVYALSQR